MKERHCKYCNEKYSTVHNCDMSKIKRFFDTFMKEANDLCMEHQDEKEKLEKREQDLEKILKIKEDLIAKLRKEIYDQNNIINKIRVKRYEMVEEKNSSRLKTDGRQNI